MQKLNGRLCPPSIRMGIPRPYAHNSSHFPCLIGFISTVIQLRLRVRFVKKIICKSFSPLVIGAFGLVATELYLVVWTLKNFGFLAPLQEFLGWSCIGFLVT